jgi:hypothetical protein
MQEKRRLLSFVIVGGGPTGVEVAAEVYDMVVEDMKRLYPQLISFVKIRVIELMDHVLSTYDRKIGEYTAQLFKRNGIELVCPCFCSNLLSVGVFCKPFVDVVAICRCRCCAQMLCICRCCKSVAQRLFY